MREEGAPWGNQGFPHDYEMRVLAERFAAEIAQARLVTIPDAAHLPSLEQRATFDKLVLEFFAENLV